MSRAFQKYHGVHLNKKRKPKNYVHPHMIQNEILSMDHRDMALLQAILEDNLHPDYHPDITGKIDPQDLQTIREIYAGHTGSRQQIARRQRDIKGGAIFGEILNALKSGGKQALEIGSKAMKKGKNIVKMLKETSLAKKGTKAVEFYQKHNFMIF